MIKTACEKPHQIKESPGNNAAQLRLLRNAFLKRYAQDGREFSADQLTTFLLYFALRFLEQNNNLSLLAGKSVLANKSIVEMPLQGLACVGNELFDLVRSSLPANFAQVMIAPNVVCWQEAKTFFESQSNDLIFADITNLGFAYQIFSLVMRTQQALPALQKADKKISRQELISFTQLYTPSWVVDFLVSNTILPDYNKKDISRRFRRWIIDDDQFKQSNSLELSTMSLLDPACGAGQFLFSAFDLLSEIAEQEGEDRREASNRILSQNIFGADLDEKALWVAGLALISKYLLVNNSLPGKLLNLLWLSREDISARIEESSFLGSIDKRLMTDHPLKKSYRAIVTNPPYLGRKCLSRELKAALKEQYPNSSNDLAAAFIERCVDLLEPGGRLGAITQASLLSIPSYQGLRDYLVSNYCLNTVIRCGPGVFPLASGEKIDSLLLLLNAPLSKTIKTLSKKTCFINISRQKEKEEQLLSILSDTLYDGKNNESIVFTDQANIKHIGALFAGLPAALSKKIDQFPKLGDMAEIRQGLATTDNARFVRYHFDVEQGSIGTEWVPYVKGSGSERYASKNPFVVKWAENGKEIKEAVTNAYPYLKGKTAWVVKNEEYYFRAGLCFSFINKAGLAVRRLPAGAIFDVASSAIFAAPEEEDFLLAYLNSTLVGILANSINQTINLQVGDIKKIPIIPFGKVVKNELSIMGRRCLRIKERLLHLQNVQFSDQKDHLLSSEHFESVFKKYYAEQIALVDELKRLQENIDDKVKITITELTRPNEQEEKLLCDWKNTVSTVHEERLSLLDTKLFAMRILIALIARTLSNGAGEGVRLAVFLGDKSFGQFANISDCAQKWLEQKIGKSLEQLFCQAKVLDINKLAGEASRYFSLWLEEKNASMFLSATALRSLHKSNADPQLLEILQPIITELELISDWTSKDLHKILMTYFPARR